MTEKSIRRSSITFLSASLWTILAIIAGGMAVETLMSNDGQLMVADVNGNEDITGSISPEHTSYLDDQMSQIQSRILETKIAGLSASIDKLIQANAELAQQLSESGKRIARMEETFDSMTASISPSVATPNPIVMPNSAIPVPTIKPHDFVSENNSSTGNISSNHVPFPVNSSEPINSSENAVATNILNSDKSTTPTPDPPAEIAVVQTVFAISVARSTDIEMLVQDWLDLRERYYSELEGLEPRVRFENSLSSGIELALVAGPLRNASDAARLCVELELSAMGCKPVVYSGDVLPLFSQTSAVQE